MDKSKQPGIKFNGIILVEEEFWRDYIIPENSAVNFDVGVGGSKVGENYNVELDSTLKLVKEDKEVLRLKSKFVGFFSAVKGEENMDIDEYVKNNAPALMFPYIREHISVITAKSGINPIFLPPINLVALLKEKTIKES